MMQRMDYWQGFTGGFLAGVALGALLYFIPDLGKKIEQEKEALASRPEPELSKLAS